MAASESDIASIDILLPVRLPAPWLDEALAGMEAQTTDTWRLVCVVHGDVGDVPEKVTRLHPDSVVVTVPGTATLVDVLNAGLAHCTATYIARLDADDIPEPDRLRQQRIHLDAHPRTALVCTGVRWIDERGNLIATPKGLSEDDPVLDGLRWKNVIAHPTVMLRADAITAVGGYKATATHAEDYDLWLRLAGAWDLARLPEPLLRYRIHGAQITKTKAISAEGRRAIKQSRLALARQRGESVAAARIRQAIWSAPQILRSIRRRSA